MVRPRRFQLFLILIAAVTIFFFLTNFTQHYPNTALISHQYFKFDFSAEEPEVDPNQVCLIPRIHPFDPSIWRYFYSSKPISCKVRFPSLTFVDPSGWLMMNLSALGEAGYSLKEGLFINVLNCYWQTVLRGGREGTDDDTLSYGEQHVLNEDGVCISDYEFVLVWCRNFAGVRIYENIHAHIRNITFDAKPSGNQMYNVLIFGLDSLSRQAFIRLLPQTYSYLTRNMSSFVFSGVNKIGDNTFPNLVALLTGKAAYESSLSTIEDFDDWPLIWRNYSDNGYVTLWAEDFPDFGLFNYLAKGFRNPPVHHYLRPFWLAVRDSSALRSSSHMCFGSSPRHRLQIDYLQRFIQKYNLKGRPFFGFSFLAELSHEYISRIGAADEDFETFFRVLHEGNYLEDTLLIVMSDHGHRFDAIRSTQVGRLEERLPFLSLYIPPKLRTSNKHIIGHLEANRGRLTTPYDIHATLINFLQFSVNGQPLGVTNLGQPHSRTLFGSIPLNRTCTDAEIPPHYCTCERETPISVDDIRVRTAVRVLFNKVNTMLRIVKDFCVELLPGHVLNAQVINTVDNKGTKDRIRVTVAVSPSDAVLEATVEVRLREVSTKFKNSLPYDAKVLGDVSRINKYGNQSSCIRDDILRKYCYCQKQKSLPKNRLKSYQEQSRKRTLSVKSYQAQSRKRTSSITFH